MNRLAAALQLIAGQLSTQNRPWALVGGLAVSVRTEPRFTRDIDLAIAVEDDQSAESLVHSLVVNGYRVFATVEQEEAGRLATVRLTSPGEGDTGVVVDLLFASSGIEPELVSDAESVEVFPGIQVPVASLGHLLAMKVLSNDVRRPQDLVDIAALIREASDEELARARDAVGLIARRGFGRGKDVGAELEAFVRSHR